MKTKRSYLKFFIIFSLIEFSFFFYSPALSLDLDKKIRSCRPAIDFEKIERVKKKHVMDKEAAQICLDSLNNSSTWDFYDKGCKDRINKRFFNELKNDDRNTKWSFFHDESVFNAVTGYVEKFYKSNENPRKEIEMIFKGKLTKRSNYQLGGEIHTYEVELNDETKKILGLKGSGYKFGVISKGKMENKNVENIKLEFHMINEGGLDSYKLISVYP